jgi:two-component system, chemotaxis family, sensor kinase CheA
MTFDNSRYLTLFVSEATEHLEALSKVIVELEKSPTQELIDAAFRHAHSVKGMSASMGFENTAKLAHALEDVLSVARENVGTFSKASADAVLKSVDTLASHVKLAQSQSEFPDVSSAIEQLKSASAPTALDAPRFKIVFRVSAGAAQPGVRAFLAYKRLSGLGSVFQMQPSIENIKTGRIPRGLVSLELETANTDADIRQRLLAVADIEIESLSSVAANTATEKSVAAVPVGQETVRSVRVKAEDFDGLLDDSSEVLLATARLRGEARTAKASSGLMASIERVHALAKSLHQKVMLARLTPVAVMTDRWPRAVRDMARGRGREIEFIVEGDDVELDRAIIDELSEPLLHVLRNAVDHGLESPQERLMRGKDARATIVVAVKRARDRVELTVRDNGRGFDTERLRQVAIERGIMSPEGVAALNEKEVLMLACLPGVSTSASVTDSSGRGVGMDTMKRAVESIGGRFELESTRGEGSTVRLSLPLTVAVLQILLVSSASELYGIPISRVGGVVEVERKNMAYSRDRPVLHFAEAIVPVCSLSELLGLSVQAPASSHASFVVVEREEGRVAFEVDALLGQEESILKPLAKPLDSIAALSGVTILSSGQPVFILDVNRISLKGTRL